MIRHWANIPFPRASLLPPPEPQPQGPVQLTWCKVGMAYCDDDCDHCLPWLATCQNCEEHGHQCGEWIGHEVVSGSGSVVTYCKACADLLKIEQNI